MTTMTHDAPAAAVRLNADSRLIVYTAAVLVGALGVTSLVASFQGLLTVAAWALLPAALTWTVPVALDGAILIYTLVALVRRARGESTRLAWTAVALGTALSATANALHVVLDGADPTGPWVRGIGAGVAALAPILAALAVHALADLAIAPPVRRGRRVPSRAARGGVSRAVAPAPVPGPVGGSVVGQAGGPARTVERSTERPTPAPAVVVDRDAARGRALELARQGLSQRQIAAAVGASKTSVGRWLAEVA